MTRIRTGDYVMVMAKDDFYAFIDGWCGRVVDWQAGCAQVVCARPDGVKVLFVPPDQLALTIRGVK